MKNKKQNRPTVVDMFAGAGGLSIGFTNAGFDLVGATDFDKWSCESLRLNHPDTVVVEGDVLKLDTKEFQKKIGKTIDVIIGGPPCQGFSTLGKQMKFDPRNQLLFEYLRFVSDIKPKVFVMENVPELLKSNEYTIFKEKAEKIGYQVVEKVLNSADYGVPQRRKRAIVIGSKVGAPKHPQPTHIEPVKKNLLSNDLKDWVTVKEAFNGLPLIPDGNNLHVGRNPTPLSIERYKHVPPGGNRFDLPDGLKPDCWRKKLTGSHDVFGRLWWDRPSLTVRTEFYKPEKGRYLHPSANRPITLREAARLQTFPDTYKFFGSNAQVAKQIGNAVPSLLAQRIAEEIIKLIER